MPAGRVMSAEVSAATRDVEQVLHRAQPAVVVVVDVGGSAGHDVRADQHAAGVTTAGGRVGGVVQRVAGLARSAGRRQVVGGRVALGAQGYARDRARRCPPGCRRRRPSGTTGDGRPCANRREEGTAVGHRPHENAVGEVGGEGRGPAGDGRATDGDRGDGPTGVVTDNGGVGDRRRTRATGHRVGTGRAGVVPEPPLTMPGTQSAGVSGLGRRAGRGPVDEGVVARAGVELVAGRVGAEGGVRAEGLDVDVGAADVLAGRVSGDAVGTVDGVGARSARPR